MITRTITRLAGDGQYGIATKEEKTLSLRTGLLIVRTAGKRGGVCFCLLSTIIQLQSLDLSCCNYWFFYDSHCQKHAKEGRRTVLSNNAGRKCFPSTVSCSQLDERKVMPSCAQRPDRAHLNPANKHILPPQTLHEAPVELAEPEGQGNHLAACITSQSSTLLPRQKLQQCLWDLFLLNSCLFPGENLFGEQM